MVIHMAFMGNEYYCTYDSKDQVQSQYFEQNLFCYYKQHKGDNFSIEEVKNIIADNEMKVN